MLAVFSRLFVNGKGHFVSIIHLGFLSQILADALKEFGRMIDSVEDERDRMVCVWLVCLAGLEKNLNFILSFGQAALPFCLPRDTSCSS